MNTLSNEMIRNWLRGFFDMAANTLKVSMRFKQIATQEVLYHHFVGYHTSPQWVVLCNDTSTQKSIVITMDYACIQACTHAFFSAYDIALNPPKSGLSFSEEFMATRLSEIAIDVFSKINVSINFIRNEPDLALVHPFNDDESVSHHHIEWLIGNQSIGSLHVCHSHVL